ncbi:MAG: DUF2797 domain-containing protein, partial [Bacteroidota bacterium]
MPLLIPNLPTSSGRFILTGYTYHLEQGPCWQIDDLGQTPTRRYILPIKQQTLSLQQTATRYCIGTYDAATKKYIPCPHRRQVTPPYQNCYPCFEAIGFNPAFYNVPQEQLSERQQAYNREPHCTYLAYFGPGVIKVGIARHARVQKRWLEQGARAAVVLQVTPDAYQARELEEKVSTTFRIPERITSTQKKQLLNIPYSFSQANAVLSRRIQAITKTLEPAAVPHPVQDLQAHYFSTLQPSTLLDADRRKQPIAGRVVGMVGDLLVYESEDRFWMAALKGRLGQAFVHLP